VKTSGEEGSKQYERSDSLFGDKPQQRDPELDMNRTEHESGYRRRLREKREWNSTSREDAEGTEPYPEENQSEESEDDD